jgi:transposase
LLTTLDTECASVERLGQAVTEAFAQHPNHQIITSFTGLGDLTGVRILAEIGDNRTRFADARALKAYAGSASVTRDSGHRLRLDVDRRRALTRGQRPLPPPREHLDRHAAALRNVFNRLIGCLHHCVQTGRTYDELKAFPPSITTPETTAACATPTGINETPVNKPHRLLCWLGISHGDS